MALVETLTVVQLSILVERAVINRRELKCYIDDPSLMVVYRGGTETYISKLQLVAAKGSLVLASSIIKRSSAVSRRLPANYGGCAINIQRKE